MPWCTGCDRFLSPSTVTVAGACPRCGATVDPGRGRPPASSPEAVEPVTTSDRSAVGEGSAPAHGPAASRAPEPVAVPESTPDGGPAVEADEETPLPIPWHFKLLVGAIALYLGWRAFQGVEWLARQL